MKTWNNSQQYHHKRGEKQHQLRHTLAIQLPSCTTWNDHHQVCCAYSMSTTTLLSFIKVVEVIVVLDWWWLFVDGLIEEKAKELKIPSTTTVLPSSPGLYLLYRENRLPSQRKYNERTNGQREENNQPAAFPSKKIASGWRKLRELYWQWPNAQNSLACLLPPVALHVASCRLPVQSKEASHKLLPPSCYNDFYPESLTQLLKATSIQECFRWDPSFPTAIPFNFNNPSKRSACFVFVIPTSDKIFFQINKLQMLPLLSIYRWTMSLLEVGQKQRLQILASTSKHCYKQVG